MGNVAPGGRARGTLESNRQHTYMTLDHRSHRRTVLKTIGAGLVGGMAMSGTATASEHENVVRVRGFHDHDIDEHYFEVSTSEFPSGWTTLEFDNRTNHPHILYLGKVPEAAIDGAADDGVGLLEYYYEHITRPFQWFMDSLVPGKEPDAADLSDKYTTDEAIFPPWFENVLPSGGTGLTSGGRTSRTTLNLAPGQYIMECYVKDSSEEFHSYNGMLELLTVTDEESPMAEPEPTIDLSLSSNGISMTGDRLRVTPGSHTVRVTVEDQQVYSHLLGHDLHLIDFNWRTGIKHVNDWMNWMAPGQLVGDGSEPGTFRGGVQTILTPELLAGNGSETAYFHVDLEPGFHAWLSEVPNPADIGMLEWFYVPYPISFV